LTATTEEQQTISKQASKQDNKQLNKLARNVSINQQTTNKHNSRIHKTNKQQKVTNKKHKHIEQ
jgi:hypothetical protein